MNDRDTGIGCGDVLVLAAQVPRVGVSKPNTRPPAILHGKVVAHAGFGESVASIGNAKPPVPKGLDLTDTAVSMIELFGLMVERNTVFVTAILVERFVALDRGDIPRMRFELENA